ncbi:MAG: hypothetical protein GY711_07270 [bacterium]|nr:hypothetical protein [bacterium]
MAIPAAASPQCVEHLRVGVDAAAASAFGCDVAIDGTAAIVGAQYQDLTGAAYVFRRSGSGGPWAQEEKLVGLDSIASDEFGASVAVAGNTIMVGASGASGAALSCGAVYVFRYDSTNGVWNQTQKIVASDGEAFDAFGGSIALVGNTALVGAIGDDGNAGSVYVLTRSPATNVWTERQKILASDRAPWEFFGYDVSIDQEWAVIGAHLDQDGMGAGGAYVFRFDLPNGLWVEHTRLAPFDLAGGDGFGFSVSVSDAQVVVGAPFDDDAGEASGSAYVFRHIDSTDSWFLASKFVAFDAQVGDRLGMSVAIDVDTSVVGASPSTPGARSGVYAFRLDSGGVWRRSDRVANVQPMQTGAFGRAVALENEILVVGGPATVIPPALGAAHFVELDTCQEIGTNYCGPAVPNSSGLPAEIRANGSNQAGGNRLLLAARELPSNQFGYFFTGRTMGFLQGPGGSQGNICLLGNVGRYAAPSQIRNSGANGTFSLDVDTMDIPLSPSVPILPGETWHFQAWYRDNNPTSTSNFTDGLTILFQ